MEAFPRLAGSSLAQRTALSLGQRPDELWGTDYKGEFLLGNGHYCYPLCVGSLKNFFPGNKFAAKVCAELNLQLSRASFFAASNRY